MSRGIFLAIGLFTLGFAATVEAQNAPPAPTGSVRVQVNGHRDVQGGRPEPGRAEIRNVQNGDSRAADLGNNGRADIGGLPDGTYEVTVRTGDRIGTTFVTVSNGQATNAELTAHGLPNAATYAASPGSLLDAVKAAIAACDKAAYDRAVGELDRDISMIEINLRDLNNIIDEYGRATGMRPDIEQLQKTHDEILRTAMTGRGALRAANRANAPVNQGLRFLPQYIAALKEKARLDKRLADLRAARQSVPAFPQKCGNDAALRMAAAQFLLSPELAVVFANRPQFAPFRLELAGVITRLGAFKPDDTDTGTRIGLSAGMRWNADFLGAKQWGIEARLWYADYDYDDAGEVRAEPGGTIGLFSPSTQANPFGGYFTAGPLTNGAYRAEVENYGGELQVQTWIRSGDFRAMPWVGVRLGRTTIAEDMRFDIGNPAFTSFEQRNDIEDTYVGPTIGVKARVDLSGGLYAFGEASAGLEYHRGKGDWRTLVPAVDLDGPRKDKLSSSKWGISAGLKAGLGFEAGGFTAQFAAGMSYTNASPYLEYKDADSTTTGTGGADIGYGRQTDYFGEARLGWRF